METVFENESGFCIICLHKHRGLPQCSYCDCNWNVREDNMVKKILQKIKDIILWPIRKVKNWWHNWG
jgi:hypothetical protein